MDQIEIRNVYSANVKYVGPIPPQNPPATCFREASAVRDAQIKIEELKKKAEEARMKMIQPGTGFGGEHFNIWRNIEENIFNIEIPIAIGNLRTAQFNYGECAGVGFRKKKPIDVLIHDEGVLNCESFEKEVEAAQAVVNNLKERVRILTIQMGMAGSFQKERFMKAIEDIQNNQLLPATEKLTAARTALENCKKNLPSDIGSAGISNDIGSRITGSLARKWAIDPGVK